MTKKKYYYYHFLELKFVYCKKQFYMTTLIINQDIKLNKSNFKDIDELLEYFILERGASILFPLDKLEMTEKRISDWDKVESMKKSQFINIK